MSDVDTLQDLFVAQSEVVAGLEVALVAARQEREARRHRLLRAEGELRRVALKQAKLEAKAVQKRALITLDKELEERRLAWERKAKERAKAQREGRLEAYLDGEADREADEYAREREAEDKAKGPL